MIRGARTDEIPRLREIERAAGTVFRELGMDAIADDDPPAETVLLASIDEGCCWVAADAGDRAVAYCIVRVVDDAGHIEEVSVHPDHARRGLGRALIDHAERWAAARGLLALTLTTFANVPWNQPYYERLGFRVMPPGSLGDGLLRLRQREAAAGLDRWPRVAMSRPVGFRPVDHRP